MIALDTNILVHAHRGESPWHDAALQVVAELAAGSESWAVPWPCIHEFLAVTTNPRLFKPPTPLPRALEQVDEWLAAPGVVLLSESPEHWTTLRSLLATGQIAGGMVHDARIAAICLDHRIEELWTLDRDFSRTPQLKVRNPLVG